MSENQGLDLGKVVELIMENPQLIAQISNLAKQSAPPQPDNDSEEAEKTEDAVQSSLQSPQPTYAPAEHKRSNRSQLLCAFKPYVSDERARAIDSMLAIADILDMMRAR